MSTIEAYITPGGIVVPEQDVDGAYADMVARQDAEEAEIEANAEEEA